LVRPVALAGVFLVPEPLVPVLWRVLPATIRARGSHAPVWRFLGNPL